MFVQPQQVLHTAEVPAHGRHPQLRPPARQRHHLMPRRQFAHQRASNEPARPRSPEPSSRSFLRWPTRPPTAGQESHDHTSKSSSYSGISANAFVEKEQSPANHKSRHGDNECKHLTAVGSLYALADNRRFHFPAVFTLVLKRTEDYLSRFGVSFVILNKDFRRRQRPLVIDPRLPYGYRAVMWGCSVRLWAPLRWGASSPTHIETRFSTDRRQPP